MQAFLGVSALKKKLLLNSVSGTALYAVNLVVTFIISPFLVHTLGNSNYGIWEVILSIVGYMGIMDLGVGPALVRFVSTSHSSGNREEFARIISSATIFFLVIGAFAATALVSLSAFPDIITKTSSESKVYITTVLLLFAANVGIRFPLTVFTGTLMGLQRHYLLNITRIVLTLGNALAVYFILVKFPLSGLITLVALQLASNLLQMLVFGGVVSLDKEIPRLSLRNCSVKTMRDLWSYGMKSMAMMLASRLQVQSMPFVIGSVLGLDKIVYFVMPRRLMEYARGLSTTIGFPLTPYFASFYGRDDHAALRNSWLKTSLALQVISNAMPVVLLFCGVPFIGQWLGAEYAHAGEWVMYVLVIGLAAESLVPNAASVLMAANRHGRMSYFLLFIAGACVPCAILAAKQWGLVGVAIACSFATVLGSSVSLWMACRELQITPLRYFRTSTLPLVVPLLILAALMWIGGVLLPGAGYVKIVLQMLIGGIGYLMAIWALVFDRETRARLAQRLVRAR